MYRDMFTCTFCESTTETKHWFNSTGLCPWCEKVKQLSKIYTIEAMLTSLEIIYIRDEDPIAARTKAVSDGVNLRSGKKVNKTV